MSTTQIVYLIIGIIFCVVGIICGYFSYWSSKNKLDEYQLSTRDWFSKFILKNRMLLFMLLFVITIASGISFIVMCFQK